VRELLGAALFFAAAASLVVLTDKLLVWGSGVETPSFIAAILAALILAKVLLSRSPLRHPGAAFLDVRPQIRGGGDELAKQ